MNSCRRPWSAFGVSGETRHRSVVVSRAPRRPRNAFAAHPDDRPFDAGVQVAAQPVVREEGVQLGQQAHRAGSLPQGPRTRETQAADGALGAAGCTTLGGATSANGCTPTAGSFDRSERMNSTSFAFTSWSVAVSDCQSPQTREIALKRLTSGCAGS
jgi:hypothetical protein